MWLTPVENEGGSHHWYHGLTTLCWTPGGGWGAGAAGKTQYRYRIELLSSFLYKFFLAACTTGGKSGGNNLSLDAALISAAGPQTDRSVALQSSHPAQSKTQCGEGLIAYPPVLGSSRPLIQSEQVYSKRWAAGQGEDQGEGSIAHTPLSKDYRGTQATGEASYITDLPEVQGTLYAAYVKSPRSVGTLYSIQVRALAT